MRDKQVLIFAYVLRKCLTEYLRLGSTAWQQQNCIYILLLEYLDLMGIEELKSLQELDLSNSRTIAFLDSVTFTFQKDLNDED